MRVHSKIFRLIFFIGFIISVAVIFTGFSSDNSLQYKLTFQGKEITVNCIKNKDGILLLPLKEVAQFVGYTDEECGRCGKDEIYDAKDKSKNVKGRLYVNWFKNIITYSNDSSIITLDANTERENGGITYTSLQLYNYIGLTTLGDDSLKTIQFTSKNITTENSKDKQAEDLVGTNIIKELVYAYDPNCSTCKEITVLLDKFKNVIKVQKIDGTNKKNTEIIDELNSKTALGEGLRGIYPIIYIGNQYLFDVEITEANIKALLNGQVFSHNFKSQTFVDTNTIQKAKESGIEIVYFYSSTCASCKKSGDFINTLKDSNPNASFITYNIFDYKSLKLLEAYGEKYALAGKDIGNIPAVFISDTALIGDEEIVSKLQDKITTYDFQKPTLLLDENTIQESNILKNGRTIKFITVFVAGLVNGINPCSLSMFLFLLSIMIVDRKKILKIGISFCIGKFTMFFLLGTFFYKTISLMDINFINIVTKVLLLIFIAVFAFLNLNDFIAARMEKYDRMVLQLPGKLRKNYHSFMKKTLGYTGSKYLIVIMVLLGMILAFGEFLCTGQIYLTSIIFMIQSSSSGFIPIMYLLLYSFAFVVPLIAMTILVYSGKRVFNLSELVLEKLPLIKIISALIFIGFGIYIIFTN